jgi:hypothetical protein
LPLFRWLKAILPGARDDALVVIKYQENAFSSVPSGVITNFVPE